MPEPATSENPTENHHYA